MAAQKVARGFESHPLRHPQIVARSTNERGYVASASVLIHAPAGRVWEALVTPAQIRQYMFGTTVVSEWREGAPITWKGEWRGKAYEDRGRILAFRPPRLLQYTHFSPLSGLPDIPENHHTVTIELTDEGIGTRVRLTQDGNPSEDARRHSERNWQMMLNGLKDLLERG